MRPKYRGGRFGGGLVADWENIVGRILTGFDNVGTPCGIACRVEKLKLKVDGTMVKLGRAAGLTGAMHEGGKNKREGNKKKKKVKANFVSLIHG